MQSSSSRPASRGRGLKVDPVIPETTEPPTSHWRFRVAPESQVPGRPVSVRPTFGVPVRVGFGAGVIVTGGSVPPVTGPVAVEQDVVSL